MPFTKIGRQTVNAVRFAEIAQVFIRHGFADILRRAGLDKGWPGKILRGMGLMSASGGEPATVGSRLRDALTELGPTFIKFGQILSTRPDLIGHEITGELSGLRDEVNPVVFDLIRPVIEQELGRSLPELFSSIDDTPVASASLSQVYHAILPSGEAVAVKVQRPDIERVIESDMSLMRAIAEWTAKHSEDLRFLDPKGIVDEFSRSILRELDFRMEARSALQFAENFRDNPEIIIPRLFSECSSRRVLTLEWIEGVPIDNVDAYPEHNSDPAIVAATGCRALCEMVFHHRLFHADPHPGNIFLVGDNKLAFLDLGMAGHLEESDIRSFSDILFAIFAGDTDACLQAVLQLTSVDEPRDKTALAHELSEYIAFEAPLVISGGEVVRGLEMMVQIMRRHNLELGPRFSLLLKALVTIEKVAHDLDPHLDMASIIKPYLEDLALSRYTPAHFLKEVHAHLGGYLQLSRQAPADIAFLLRQLRSGKMKLHVHHEHLETLASTIDRASKRNSVAVVIAALIIGSSLLFLAEGPFARLGIVGFVVAGLLGLMLILSILWGGERD